MPNYLFVYHGGGMPDTETEQKQEMEAWGAWFGELGSAIVDGGGAVGAATTVQSDGSVNDGGGANPATGYTVIQADSLSAATELAKGNPGLRRGGTLEVCETFNPM